MASRAGTSFLIGLLLALLPSAILPDLIAPFERWYNHERAEAGDPKTYTREHLPPILKTEITVFKWLTLPPNWVAECFGQWRTEYARLVAPDGLITEAWPSRPPFFFAIQHLKLAVPFWSIGAFLVLQSTSTVWRRIKKWRRDFTPP